ncbi:MAG: HEAT repeat domain-containing protein [Anaerolineales bacterium]
MEDETVSEQSDISFDEVVLALRDEEHPFPARYLYRLSALEGEELGLIRRVWFALSAQRRLGILEDLETLAESNTLLQFDAVNQVALRDEDPRVRVTAIRSLWPSEQAVIVPQLLDLLDHDESAEVRAQAASGLGRFIYLGEVGKLPEHTLKEIETRLLREVDGKGDWLIRRRALESLGYSSRPEVPDLIEQAYEHGSEEWVASALYAMGRSADDRWAPIVIESLKDNNLELSREAVRAAGELELNDALPVLVDLLQDEDSELRLAAAWSLSQIGGEVVAEVLAELLERTEDEDEIDLIEDTVENLALTHEMADLNILDFSPEDLEDLANPDPADLGEDEDQFSL